jgi:heat shock protein HslJ/uncharacterized lipoprotein YbaY
MRLTGPALIALSLLLPLGAWAQDVRTLTGQVMVLERMALPEDAVVIVDVTDTQDTPLAELRRATGGTQSPFAFDLTVPAERGLILRAGVRAGDDMLWLSEPISLVPGAEDAALGDLRALRVGPMGVAALLQCGTQTIEIGFLHEEVRLRFNEQFLALQAQPAALGELYVAADNPATQIHLKADSALLTVDGAQLSECQLTQSARDLSAGVWNIAEIGEKAAIFPSRTELVFYPDGRISASVGCNRMIGAYRKHGGVLSFGRMASTRMGCPDGLAEQEAAFFDALARVDGYLLNSDSTRLTLTALSKPVLQARR